MPRLALEAPIGRVTLFCDRDLVSNAWTSSRGDFLYIAARGREVAFHLRQRRRIEQGRIHCAPEHRDEVLRLTDAAIERSLRELGSK